MSISRTDQELIKNMGRKCVKQVFDEILKVVNLDSDYSADDLVDLLPSIQRYTSKTQRVKISVVLRYYRSHHPELIHKVGNRWKFSSEKFMDVEDAPQMNESMDAPTSTVEVNVAVTIHGTTHMLTTAEARELLSKLCCAT